MGEKLEVRRMKSEVEKEKVWMILPRTEVFDLF
jgi:hypothetical protein